MLASTPGLFQLWPIASHSFICREWPPLEASAQRSDVRMREHRSLAIDLAVPATWCCQCAMRGATKFFTSIDACKNGGWTLTTRTTAFSIDEFVGERLKLGALLTGTFRPSGHTTRLESRA